jgi:hypothetical protein
MTIDICKCGIARVDCEYHRPEPETQRSVGTCAASDEEGSDDLIYATPNDVWPPVAIVLIDGTVLRLLGKDDPEVSDDLIYSTPMGGVVAVPDRRAR